MTPSSRVECTGMVYYARVVENPVGACLAVECRLIQQDLRREANARALVAHFLPRESAEASVRRLLAGRSVPLGPGIVARVLPNPWHSTGVAEIGFSGGGGFCPCRSLGALRRALCEMSAIGAVGHWAARVCCLGAEFNSFRGGACRFVAGRVGPDSLQVAAVFNDAELSMSVALRFSPDAVVATVRARCAGAGFRYRREFEPAGPVVAAMATVADALRAAGGIRARSFDEFRQLWVSFALHGGRFSEADVLGYLFLEQSFALPAPYLSAWCVLKTPFAIDKRGGALRALVLLNERYVFF